MESSRWRYLSKKEREKTVKIFLVFAPKEKRTASNRKTHRFEGKGGSPPAGPWEHGKKKRTPDRWRTKGSFNRQSHSRKGVVREGKKRNSHGKTRKKTVLDYHRRKKREKLT